MDDIMSNKPFVSVIIPVYNAEQYLNTCLDSLAAQTLNEIEIICVDDGSADRSLAVLEQYEKADNRIHIIKQKNAGAGAARNTGMKAAEGEYLSFLDADDFFEPDMLEKAYRRARLDNSDIVVFRSDQYIEKTGEYKPMDYSIRRYLLPEKRPFAGTDVKKDVFKLFIGWPWDKLFRADFVKENGLYYQEQRTTNDLLFVFCAVVKANRISVIDNVLAHYRRSGEGISLSVSREKSWDCFYKALTALRQQLIEWNLYDRFERDFITYSLNLSLWNLNTMKGNAFFLLYEALKSSWFDDLGITGKGSDYFYDTGEYQQLQDILNHSAEDYLFLRLDQMKALLEKSTAEKDMLKRKLYAMGNLKAYRIGQFLMRPLKKLRECIRRLD